MNDTHRAGHRSGAGKAYRLTVSERVIGCVVLVLLVIAATCSHMPSGTHVTTCKVTVRAGETLWSLAEHNHAEGLDTAATAELIAEINDLPNGAVFAGATLSVPAPAPRTDLAMR